MIGIYTSRVLLYELGINDFGIYNVVCGFVTMFAFLNTSMNNGIQRFYNYELAKNGTNGARKVYHCSIPTQLVIALVIVIFTETFGLWYLYNKLIIPENRINAAVWIFHSSVVSLVFLILQIPYSASIMAHEKMDYFSLCSVIDVVFKLLIVLSLHFWWVDHLKIYGILMMCISIIDFIMYFVYAYVKFPELHGKYHFSKKMFIKMISFSGWNLFGSFSGVMKEQGLNVLLNLFFGPAINAARGLAYQVSGGVQSFIINITTAARPQLTQSYAIGNIERTINIMFSMSKISYICIYIFALPVILEVKYLMHLWLRGEVPAHTNSFVVLVILFALVNVFNPPISFVVHATGKMRKYQLLTSLWNLCLLPSSYIALYYGASPDFVFVLNILFMIINQVICVSILNTLIQFPVYLYVKKVIFSCLLMSLLASVVPFYIVTSMNEGIMRLLLTSLVSLTAICAISYFIVLNCTEKDIITNYIRKFLLRTHID